MPGPSGNIPKIPFLSGKTQMVGESRKAILRGTGRLAGMNRRERSRPFRVVALISLRWAEEEKKKKEEEEKKQAAQKAQTFKDTGREDMEQYVKDNGSPFLLSGEKKRQRVPYS